MHEGSVITVAEDLTREAQKIWNALRVMVDKEIDTRTASCVRSRKMTVMAAPNGSTIGVAEPFGETVYIPYSSTLANAKVGDSVWVDWKFNNASTMVAMATGEGQIVPDYMEINESNRNLLEARKFIQSGLTNDGDLETPTADTVPMDYAGIGSSNYYIHVKPSTNYRLTLFDTRIETESASCVVAQYASNGAFISLAASGIGWRDPQGMTFVTNVNAAFLRLSLVGFPKYRWKLEEGEVSTDWQPAPEDASPYTFDSVPTANSTNPVTSDGIYTALQDKQDTLTFDAAPISGSTNPVQSGGIYSALGNKVSKSGDTMTGYLKLPRAQFQEGDYPRITFLDSSTSTVVGSIISHNAQRRILVRQVSSNGSEETFQFPSSSSATSSAYYDVITSKGGTMTGTLNASHVRIYDASYPMLAFISSASDTSALGAIYEDLTLRRLALRQRSTSGYTEDYYLPSNTATANTQYSIATSKQLIGTLTSVWTDAVNNAMLDITVLFTPSDHGDYMLYITIPKGLLTTAYRWFFGSQVLWSNASNITYYYQVNATATAIRYQSLYRDGVDITNGATIRYIYR